MLETRPQQQSRFALGIAVGFGLAVLLGILAYKVRMPSYDRAQAAFYEKVLPAARKRGNMAQS